MKGLRRNGLIGKTVLAGSTTLAGLDSFSDVSIPEETELIFLLCLRVFLLLEDFLRAPVDGPGTGSGSGYNELVGELLRS